MTQRSKQLYKIERIDWNEVEVTYYDTEEPRKILYWVPWQGGYVRHDNAFGCQVSDLTSKPQCMARDTLCWDRDEEFVDCIRRQAEKWARDLRAERRAVKHSYGYR